MECIPAIDLLGGRVVRLHEGRFEAVTDYGDDPVGFARAFLAAGAKSIHLVDLDAAREGVFRGTAVAALKALGLTVEVAGGIRTADDVAEAFRLGADRVVVGSAATDPRRLAELLAAAGPERLVVAVDVKAGRLAVEGWVKTSSWTLEERLEALLAEGVHRIAYTAVGRDGTLLGPDWDALPTLRRFPFHLTVAGGVSSVEDLARLASAGVDAAIVGRALYEGRIALSEVFRVCKET